MRRLLLILAAAAAAQEAEKPAPGERLDLSGSADLGYRWRDVRGNSQAYRSVVDLGEGPKLFGLDFSLAGKSRKLFDRINVRALGWGGDPYTTAEVDLSRQGSYRLTWDYRNLAYFNFLPSFANPRLERGSFLSQRAFDTHRKLNDLRLDLFPGRRVIPYLAYTRDSGSGSGITTFVTEGNEYPVANRLADKTDHYRGGVRLELGRFHATVEEGGTAFKDDQRAFTSQRNLGNRATPIFGQTLELTRLEQAWGIRGDSSYTQLLFTASPASWADLSGHFLYSNPSTTSNYFQNSAGRFVDLNSLLFVAEQQERLLSGARQPHTSGDLAAEIRPLGRVRILESWMTDRLHQTGEVSLGLPDVEYNQQQLEVLCDLSSRLTLRGGHRYVWGQARVLAPVLRLRLGAEEGELRRNVLLAGATFRAARKLSVSVDAEGASGDRVYFRTSLNDYQRVRARARYQASGSLTFSGAFTFLNNENPARTIQHEFRSQEIAGSALWTPGSGKRISVMAEYSRSALRSDLTYIEPETFDRQRSLYRDNAHTGSAIADLALAGKVKLGLGGAFFVSSGSRPVRYYQPLGRLAVAVRAGLQWTSEWRWYGFAERYYVYEGFRAHQFATGFRIVR